MYNESSCHIPEKKTKIRGGVQIQKGDSNHPITEIYNSVFELTIISHNVWDWLLQTNSHRGHIEKKKR